MAKVDIQSVVSTDKDESSSELVPEGRNENEDEAGQFEQFDTLPGDDILVTVNMSDDDFQTDEEELETEEVSDNEPEDEELADAASVAGSTSTEVTFKIPEQTPEGNKVTVVVPAAGLMEMVQDLVKKSIQEANAGQSNNIAKKVAGNSSPGDQGNMVTPNKRKENNRELTNKSPSDTTIYAPGLKLINKETVGDKASPIDQISNFVEQVRLETEAVSHTRSPLMRVDEVRRGSLIQPQLGTSRDAQVTEGGTGCELREEAQARNRAANYIVQAEQYKAAIQKPGEPSFVTQPIANPVFGDGRLISMGGFNTDARPMNLNEDDEFFHLTCHVEPGLKNKILNGEFVKLEKLLPKTRGVNNRFSDESKMQLVNRDGMSWVPAEKEKINSFRRWEQAFRIYASIYSKAHPSRSPEIFQYIHVISTAANSFAWDNVAEYDYTFRQLMSNYPHRSWAKIYTQIWNLALKDLINRGSVSVKGSGTGQGYSNNNAGGRATGREKYC